MIVADTAAILAVVDRRDQRHSAAAAFLEVSEQLIIPTGIMGELAYMVESRVGATALDAVLGDIERGLYRLDCGDADVPRVRRLISRYSNLPLGYADATVIACAERLGAAIFTFDRRHFTVVAAEGTFAVVP